MQPETVLVYACAGDGAGLREWRVWGEADPRGLRSVASEKCDGVCWATYESPPGPC
jgi:hypothetical protein